MAFAAFIKRKSFKFEVLLCKDGRWMIEGILDREDDATEFARKVLTREQGDEVKIIRYRKTNYGKTFKSEVFHETRSTSAEPPISLGEVTPNAPVCQDIDDLFGPESILTISRLFRQYLIRNAITAIELLHNWKCMAKLIDAGNLLNSATHKVATVQAAGEHQSAKNRLQELEELTRAATVKARELAAQRTRLPRPDESDLNAISELIRARFDDGEHDYVFLTVMAQKFYGMPSVSHKFEELLKFLDGDIDQRLFGPLEGMVAECLDFADVVQELFGPHPHLASFLCRLTDTLNDRLQEDDDNISAALVKIGGLIASGEAPRCREVLFDRLVGEIRSSKPFNRRSPEKESHWLEVVLKHLRRDDGSLLGGEAVEKAIAVRERRLRQRELRELGLVDAADAM